MFVVFRGIVADPWLIGLLIVSAVLFSWQLAWGLPNGNSSWAADAIGPVTSLGIVYRSFAEWNSGWYYFKYPLGYPFLLFLVTSPYLAWQYVSGAWTSPATEYPYGFADPEHALFVMAMIGRGLNVLFALGVVAVTYGIGRRLLGLWPARVGAFLVATAYPVIYYAHTTNLDIGYLFWLLLALYAAIVARDSDRWLPWATLGAAAAMAVSSKEQGFAFLLPLPVMALAGRVRARGLAEIWSRPALAMAGSAVAVVLLANNILFNPMGFVGRIAFLLGHPLEPVSVRLAPVEFALWKGAKEWVYVRQLWDGLESTLGAPAVCLSLVGVGLAMARRRTAALWLLIPSLSQYYVSLRGLDLITVRYLLPISVVLALLAAAALVESYRWWPSARWRASVVAVSLAVCALAAGRALETLWLFETDARYQAERWMETHAAPDSAVEYYQKDTYLPRFRGSLHGRRIPIAERTVAGLARRDPAYIVLSSASRKSIAHIWNPDWRETRELLQPIPEAAELLEKLEGGDLGYRQVASFSQHPVTLRLRITSLAPEIQIYARQ